LPITGKSKELNLNEQVSSHKKIKKQREAKEKENRIQIEAEPKEVEEKDAKEE
jgi:hypothetical protein